MNKSRSRTLHRVWDMAGQQVKNYLRRAEDSFHSEMLAMRYNLCPSLKIVLLPNDSFGTQFEGVMALA